MESGTCIRPHVDAGEPPADVVLTLIVRGKNTVRVGNVLIDVNPGDVYAIADAARWDVKHEVLAGWTDRLSVTIRFTVR